MIKSYFRQELQRLSDRIKDHSYTMSFVLVADSHLDDYEEDTLQNIQAADKVVSYDFMVHLGDFMNGNFPKGYTAKILQEEMVRYRSAIKNGNFYPVQGNHDGYCNSTFKGRQCDIVVDEDWYVATVFTEEYENVIRERNRPYFYADYSKQKLRLIFLCSFSYEETQEHKYRKLYRVSQSQIEWLEKEALEVGEEWTVMLFSHDGPLRFYDQDRMNEEPFVENTRELLDAVLHAREKHGFSVAGWFIGHAHGDLCQTVLTIPFVFVGSQTYYVPQLWSMPQKGHFEPREVGALSQDLWDSVTWDKTARTLHLFRFGAGGDRVIRY